MADGTKIEWCDATFNPWVGCQKVSPGCDHCYAEGWAKRSGQVQWGPHADRRRTSAANWRKPLQWAKAARFDEARYIGPRPRPRVFCASLADVFDNQVPPMWRRELFDVIRQTPELDWLLLTKRPENIRKMLPTTDWCSAPWPNVWLGTTAEDQEHFDRRWRVLSGIPAAVRFISHEPSLGPLRMWEDHGEVPLRLPFPDWIICGGESGPKARMMDLAWARELRDDCAHLGIAYFFKQTTGKAPIPDDLMVRQFPAGGANR